MVAVDHVEAVSRRGLAGDRYLLGTGYYSDEAGWGANVTLIQSEVIAAVNAGHASSFTGDMLRRNIVTANVKLETLIGRDFQCGSAIFRGTKPFPPCAHLAYIVGCREVLKYFAFCGGIGADVVTDGVIRFHDQIKAIE
jgi:MOSC domain-containing protein YiiM